MPSLFHLLAATAAAAVAPPAQDARAFNLPGLFSADDYPLESLRNNEQGTVKVRLAVDASGAVASCTVIESSGHTALDERTCAVLQERAKFEPAKDRSGSAVESGYNQTITWKLADGPPAVMPRSEWMVRMTIGVSSDGSPVDCKIELVGVESPKPTCEMPRKTEPGNSAEAAPIFAYAITETYFYPVDPNDAPVTPELEGAIKGAKQISRVTITPDGQIIACEGILYAGDASPAKDRCRLQANRRFDPVPPDSGPQTGTLVQTEYLRIAGGA